MQYYGSSAAWDEVVLRGQPAQGSFISFYLREGRVEAACLVNRSRDASVVKRLLGQTALSSSELAADEVPLKTLLRTEVTRRSNGGARSHREGEK